VSPLDRNEEEKMRIRVRVRIFHFTQASEIPYEISNVNFLPEAGTKFRYQAFF